MIDLSYIKFFLFLIAGLVAGFVTEKLIFFLIRFISRKTNWGIGEVFISSLRSLITITGFIVAFYISYPYFVFLLPHQSFISKTILALVILLITVGAVRLVGGLIGFYMSKQKGALPTTSIFVNIARIVVFSIGFLVLLQTLGIAITPIITTLGIGGVAIALALQETLSNLFAGLQILAAKQLKPGDFVRLETGEFGQVVDITWRNTTIKDFSESLIIIPNNRLANSMVVNYNLPKKVFKLKVEGGVAYKSDLDKVEKIAIEEAKAAVREVEDKEPPEEPVVRFQNFGESSINFNVIISINNFQNQYIVKHNFIKRLHKRFNEEGIEIPFPTRTIYLKK